MFVDLLNVLVVLVEDGSCLLFVLRVANDIADFRLGPVPLKALFGGFLQ